MTDPESTDGETSETTPVGLSLACELLAHPHRRHALSVLRERGSQMTLDEVARAVTLRVDGVTLGDDFRERFDQVRVGLYHNHLPKLCDAGVIAYDRDRRTVALAEERGRVVRLLDDFAFTEMSPSSD